MKFHGEISIESIEGGRIARQLIPLLATLGGLGAQYLVFYVVPTERVMGDVQRIFYMHVGSAMASYAMIALLFVGSVTFLATRRQAWDFLAESAASVAFLFCSVVLVTGMIWGHSAWNTWWRWEPRLVSFLVLWLILFSYVVLRNATRDLERRGSLASVVGIIAAVNVPIVMYSIKLLDHTQQLHPEVVAKQGLTDSTMIMTLVVAIVALVLFALWLCLLRLASVANRARVAVLGHAAFRSSMGNVLS